MTTDPVRDPAGQALVSDGAATHLHPSGFDPSRIPRGPYCYASLDPMNEEGAMHINSRCPYWHSLPDEHARCEFLNYTTEFSRELLWDQVKVCRENHPDDFGDVDG